MRVHRLLCAIFLYFAASPIAYAQSPNDVYGIWRHEGEGNLQIYPCSSGVCIKIINSFGNRKDEYNPNPALRNRSVVGMVILRGARQVAAHQWTGTLYNILDGETYRGSINLISRNKLTLVGCTFGILKLCKAVSWTRIK
jgi:uncharacterized protein (DUF2147 family)